VDNVVPTKTPEKREKEINPPPRRGEDLSFKGKASPPYSPRIAPPKYDSSFSWGPIAFPPQLVFKSIYDADGEFPPPDIRNESLFFPYQRRSRSLLESIDFFLPEGENDIPPCVRKDIFPPDGFSTHTPVEIW